MTLQQALRLAQQILADRGLEVTASVTVGGRHRQNPTVSGPTAVAMFELPNGQGLSAIQVAVTEAGFGVSDVSGLSMGILGESRREVMVTVAQEELSADAVLEAIGLMVDLLVTGWRLSQAGCQIPGEVS